MRYSYPWFILMAYLELHQTWLWFTVCNCSGSGETTTLFMADKRGSVHCSGFLCKERTTEHNHALKQGVPFYTFRIVSALFTCSSLRIVEEMKAQGWYLCLPECAVVRKLPGWKLPLPEIIPLRPWVLLRFNQLRIAEREDTCLLQAHLTQVSVLSHLVSVPPKYQTAYKKCHWIHNNNILGLLDAFNSS